MRFLFYRLSAWIRDTRRTDYMRPILIAVLATAVLVALYVAAEVYWIPQITLWQSRLAGAAMSCVLTGAMAYVALRLYRQMAQDTIDELRERLRLSEKLLEERNLVNSLMENSADRIYFKDLDGRYLRASASAAAAFGLSHAGDIVGRSDFDFYEESYARALRADEQGVVRTSQPLVGRSYGERWRDGRETWASISMAPLHDRHGQVIGIIGIARDITAIRAQEQQVRQLSQTVEQSPHMVMITSAAGHIEYINFRFCESTGYLEDEVCRRQPDFLHADGEGEAPRLVQRLERCVQTGAEWRGELQTRRKNGEVFWARFTISPIRNSDGDVTHLVSIAEDISREKEIAAAIQVEQQHRRELERIITISPAIVFLWRAEANWPVEYVSGNIEQWGYSAEDLTSGRVPYSDVVYPEDLPRVAEEVEHFRNGEINSFVQEYRIVQKDKKVRWIEDRTWVRRDDRGNVTHFQGVVFDITERKHAEAAQQVLSNGLRSVLQLADEMLVCPDEDALFRRAVELGRARLGLERCGILIRDRDCVRGTYGTGLHGETTDEHTHEFPLNERWRERLRVRLPEESRWQLVEEPYRVWQNGAFVDRGTGWVALTQIQSTTREPIGLFCNDCAITRTPPDFVKQEVVAVFCSLLGTMVARMRIAQEQQAAVAQQREMMERTDRLNSLGLLAAGMAHEINNPLQGMMSHVRAVERSLPEKAPAQNSLAMVARGIETIAGLVRKLLVLGTAEKGTDKADASDCVELVMQLLGAPLRNVQVKVETAYPTQRLILAIPRSELIQVILNLSINARDAMPDGGAIRVHLSREAGFGIIRIEDTGTGIPPEIVSRIFTPFFTTKGVKGTGLGLSVVESLVRGNHGTIAVESPPGRGAIFTLRIPLA
ncbi:MAG: PAS domain S-box protein [Kiritimatiellae bacterium]|nr:PAS domain S-box protein [Kiritimatiellia bacterium]